MLKIFQRSTVMNELPILEQTERLNLEFNENEMCFDHLDSKLQNITNKLDNLKAVVEQIEREKTCWINKLLES